MEAADDGAKRRAKLLGGLVRMEISLGGVLTLMMIVGIAWNTLRAYDDEQASVRSQFALLRQQFVSFQAQTQAQLDTITVQTVKLPVTDSELAAVNNHLHAIDGRLDGVDNRLGAVERLQAGTQAEVDSIVRASSVPTPTRR